ncbi:CopG family transcriptional regulator [Accumulibacter sp.]|jgi:Predicted transcriptional regulator|uniref:Transcriptional regulator, CopG family n=1 Tax=Accumulibacter regalis TaxID=522306 RepID=C7RPU7_ACCRE|nr:CopG family transcriptional regulator [Accumulibacter sp.]MBN8496577.1 CopG family transcriptional regulator [Accumulibacter sp.]MBO3714323.1 CopG family transcriptional regulator [Accumulibacter sp.]
MSATLTIKPDLKAKLETLANVMHRDQSELANEAIGLYVERETLLLEKIRNGLAQAERGEFVPDGEMDAFFAEHGFIVEP